MGMVFACSQGMGPITGTSQAYNCYVDSNAPELKTSQLGEPYLIGRGVIHTF